MLINKSTTEISMQKKEYTRFGCNASLTLLIMFYILR